GLVLPFARRVLPVRCGRRGCGGRARTRDAQRDHRPHLGHRCACARARALGGCDGPMGCDVQRCRRRARRCPRRDTRGSLHGDRRRGAAAPPRSSGEPMNGRAVAPLYVALAAFALALATPPGDPDTYWHLASGKWMVDHGALLRTDVFSSTVNGQPYSVGEWLGEIVLYL